ncbi:SRPBCC domain-containing protein [Maritimibacter sp. DP1N21-5]|uniref:SRPBCC domain-containing protein n=1 Tax=Maritimibacter sp. DP1N21-5 TaxID=2836867 RepID=UPI001C43DE54|nr:SRPBCC domain-containing protein [Maritimibacter sp. DP1N21-5]MBV7407532.1 SRPBCC domain-containing protein [Maritimibacter sp. DP1N21-5]
MSVDHQTFAFTRVIGASPSAVFRAFAEEELKRKWFLNPHIASADYALDFRVGGQERGRFVMEDGPAKGIHENSTHYLDIRDGERIVYAYSMTWDGRVHSSSLVTVELAATEAGTRLDYTEQGAFFEDSDGGDMRKGGMEALIDALAAQFG